MHDLPVNDWGANKLLSPTLSRVDANPAIKKPEDYKTIGLCINELKERKEMNFRRRLSEIACKSPYAAMAETYICG
mgnify:CR=1 FL=1